MDLKNIKIGEKEFKYNLPSDPNINKYIIKVYNKTSKQISYDFFTEDMEEWSLVAHEDDCVTMTIYGTTENGKVVNEEFYRKTNSGEVEKLPSDSELNAETLEKKFSELNLKDIENELEHSLDTIQCEVKEMVDSPNISNPVFKLKAAQESNSHTNFYVQIIEDGDTKLFIKLSKSEDNEIIDRTIQLKSRSNYGCKLYKVNKIDEHCVVTGVTRVTWQQFTSKTTNYRRDDELKGSLEGKKNVKIGKKKFEYDLPSNSGINKFIIKVYNETSKQISYYFVTEDMEEWSLVDNDDACVIMTIYGTTENGKVVKKDYYKKKTSGDIEKLSSRPEQSKPRLDTIQRKGVKEISYEQYTYNPVFKLKAAQESNSDTNYYVQFLKQGDTKFIKLATSENNEIKDTTIKLKSRRNYEYKLYKVNKIDEQCVVTGVTWVTLINFKTCNCQKDVEELMEKARSFINRENLNECEVKYLYRNKPSDDETIKESKGTHNLKKYLKNNNGDEYSSINKKICGLHFSATPEAKSGDLPDKSYFGDYRIMIYPEYLVEGCNLYFADFYCMFSDRSHWVLLVLTKRESEEDKFCQHRLVKLDIKNNPFFYKSGDKYKVKSWNKAISSTGREYNHTYLYCAILYTEDINLREMRSKTEGFAEEYNILPSGDGKSTTDGINKKAECEICNLPINSLL